MNLIQKFSSLDIKVKIVIIVAIILFLIWFFRSELPKLELYFQPRSITLQPGENVTIADTRKKYIENLANQLYNNIYSTLTDYSSPDGSLLEGGHSPELYNEANALTDNELLYLSNYYKQYLSNGNTLYADIGNEYFFFSDAGTKLQAHLSKIGER